RETGPRSRPWRGSLYSRRRPRHAPTTAQHPLPTRWRRTARLPGISFGLRGDRLLQRNRVIVALLNFVEDPLDLGIRLSREHELAFSTKRELAVGDHLSSAFCHDLHFVGARRAKIQG